VVRVASRHQADVQNIYARIGSEAFRDWYHHRQTVENIRNGQPYFNGPSPVTPPERHSPSRLLQCHRKTYYSQLNAPEETTDPRGIFWFGTHFEEDLVLPFLQDAVADEETFVCNSLWVDFVVETDVGEIRIRGETDPVVVDSDSAPLLLFEIKTKRTVDNVTEPNRHHKAQAHAYMHGLSEKYERDIDQAVILYGGRTSLEIRPFLIEFDEAFWNETLITWAETQTTYRLDEELPPASPEYNWECEFCPYRERCGEGDLAYGDSTPTGLLPGFPEYPRKKVVDYLEAHQGVGLTPTLAWEYPDLAEEYRVYDWQCSRCDATHDWQIENSTETDYSTPDCPACTGIGPPGQLVDPGLNEQQPPEGINGGT
jgi:CRISPR/Cas system-associated exonuclease Cas4 (RecB family)